MRFANFDQLDPAWLLHHFEWERGSDGIDRLVVRGDFVPLPYRGEYSNENDYSHYQLEPAGAALRVALEEWLVSALKAEALPGNGPDEFSHGFLVNGVEVSVMASDGLGLRVDCDADRGERHHRPHRVDWQAVR